MLEWVTFWESGHHMYVALLRVLIAHGFSTLAATSITSPT
jgi:hypothetical protein